MASSPVRAALLLLAAALPAFAAGGDLSIKDAIQKLQAQRQFLIDNHIANMQKRGQTDADVASALSTGELQARSRTFIGQMHDDVIARLRAQDKPGATVSSQEVDKYVEAFRKELYELRNAMVDQAHEQLHNGGGPPKAIDWNAIVDNSRDKRLAIVNEYANSPVDHPGPVRLSNIVIETLKPKDAGGTPGGSGAVPTTGGVVPTTGGIDPTNPAGGTGVTPNPGVPATTPGNAGASAPGTGPADGGKGVAPTSPEQSANDRLALGDVTGAKSDLNAAVNSGTAGPDAYALRGELAMNDGRFSSAVQDARQALQLDPKNQNALAILHNSEGRMDGAPPEQGGSAPGSAPAAASVGGGAGGSAYGGSSPGSPASFGASAVSSSGGAPSVSALSRLSAGQAQTQAQSALGMNDLAGARAYVDRALAQDPSNPSLLNLRAVISARGRDFGRAESDARAGLAIAPKDPALLRTLGFAQVRNKDYKDAVASANSMMERDPNDAYAYALRAHAYGSMGDREAMMADLKRAAELDPRFRDAAAKMEGQLQLPNDADILFLFPGEDAAGATAAAPAAPAAPAGRNFALAFAAAAAGGLLLAFGMKDRIAASFARLTRTGPTVSDAAPDDEDPPPPAV